jgi:hypothetical protein
MNLANRLLLGSLLIGLVCTVDPRNADVLYSTSVVTVKSTDGGAHWSSLRGVEEHITNYPWYRQDVSVPRIVGDGPRTQSTG